MTYLKVLKNLKEVVTFSNSSEVTIIVNDKISVTVEEAEQIKLL